MHAIYTRPFAFLPLCEKKPRPGYEASTYSYIHVQLAMYCMQFSYSMKPPIIAITPIPMKKYPVNFSEKPK